jgi:hypothetical protein
MVDAFLISVCRYAAFWDGSLILTSSDLADFKIIENCKFNG